MYSLSREEFSSGTYGPARGVFPLENAIIHIVFWPLADFRGILMDLTDEALVSACCSGDETAWETLINRYQRLVYSIPRRAGLDEFSSAEVFQNVFTILVESLGRIRQPDRIQAWLVTTARRETWRFVRKQKESAAMTISHEDDEGGAL